MYLRESSRRNKDGSKVTYLQLAHNERHPVTGSPVAKVIHNFGRKDKVDKEGGCPDPCGTSGSGPELVSYAATSFSAS